MPKLAFALFALILLGGLWGIYRTPPAPIVGGELELAEITPAASGNSPHLVAIQPWMRTRDYRSAATLEHRLDAYLSEARDAGLLASGSIVVMPEHIGTWLVAADAPAASFSAGTTTGAMTHLILANPLPFAAAFLRSNEADRMAAAVFRMRGDRMARDYQRVFAHLAERNAITLVGGSIVLPEPQVRDGRLIAGNGPLYNVSAVFHADGSIDPALVRKVHPIPDEAGFTAAATVDNLPVFDTPSGRLGVLICADSWHPDVYAALREGGAGIIAVPAYLQPSGVWDQPWGGYTTGWPDDVDPAVMARHTEGDAWMSYSLADRLFSTDARWGATAFMRGALWNLGSDGANILVAGDTAWIAGQLDGASISALPLPASRP
ncbi:nitrilase-related carbon-nitrogen hydrolase [Maricaulis sp.]|uniref:nitrilase-related carbon-nitrogen hydrolase n=1 Tax=Maricaulis sp. TaxID=1486257 RepID=UPI003A937489